MKSTDPSRRTRPVALATVIGMLAAVWPDGVGAQSPPYLVRDIEDQRQGRLPFEGFLWNAPQGAVVPNYPHLWRIHLDGSATFLVDGRTAAQLPSGDLIVVGGPLAQPPGDLYRSDGQELDLLGRPIGAQTSAPWGGRVVAELGDAVVFNGWVGSRRGWGTPAHWLIDGPGPPLEIGPYGERWDGGPFSPKLCTESLELAGGVLFCGNESSGFAARLWFLGPGSAVGQPISDTRSSYFGFRANSGLVFGLFPGGAFRSDGTSAGTTLFDGLGDHDYAAYDNPPRLLDDGVAWVTYGSPQRLWFLGAAGSPTILFESTTDPLRLVGAAGETAFVQLESQLLAISHTGSVTELGEFPWLLFGAPLGPSRAVFGVPREPNHVDLIGVDGSTVFTLVEGASDHEGPTAGSALAHSAVEGGVVVGLYDEESETRPWLIGPSFALEPWRDVRLAGTRSSSPGPFRQLGGELLFLARTSDGGTRPWWSDGTTLGTRPASPTAWAGCRTTRVRQLVLAGDRVVLGCVDLDGSTPVYEVAQSGDLVEVGRVAGPTPLGYADAIHAATLGDRVVVSRRLSLVAYDRSSGTTTTLAASLGDIAAIGERVVFFGRPAAGQPWALWATDGTSEGTGPISADLELGSQPQFRRVGDRVVFAGVSRLFATDGTAPGTVELGAPLLVLPSPPGAPRGCGIGDDGLWGFDPVTGTRELLASVAGWFSDSSSFAIDEEASWFVASVPGATDEPGSPKRELWRCDGTQVGSGMVRSDLPATTNWLAPTPRGIYALVHGEDVLLRIARDGSEIETLLSLPPTVNDDRSSPSEASLLAVGPHVFFTAADEDHGRELWAVRWDVEIFQDGFESGDTTAWSP